MTTLLKTVCVSAILGCTYGAFSQQQVFTTNSNFTVPEGVKSVYVECVGAGGAGGRVTSSNFLDKDAAGGGGGGAYAAGFVSVVNGNSYPVIVGTGGKNDGSSVDGGNSYFSDGTQILAEGGKTRPGNDEEAGAEGGKAANSIGQIKYNGGKGGNGKESDADGGGGGGAAGSTGNGNDGATVTAGANKANYGGAGGNGGDDGATGNNGASYGGGGGGSSANGGSTRNGGNGANGVVVISWSKVNSFSPNVACQNETITVKGINFSATDSVYIGSQSVNFTIENDSTLKLTTNSSTTNGKIKVFTKKGDSESLTALEITQSETVVSLESTYLKTDFIQDNSSTSYQWYNCITNAPLSGATGTTYTPAANGIYKVIITHGNCQITSNCFTFSSLSTDEITTNSFVVYPNPSNGEITVEYANVSQLDKIRILDITGKQVFETNGIQTGETLNVSHLNDGNYFIQFQSENRIFVQKFNLKK